MSSKHASLLSAVAKVEVRFNECDPLGIVWHGNYVNYFQEGREAFSKKYDLDYLYMYENGFATPIVHLSTDFKKTLKYRDIALVETTMRYTPAAKIIFDYVIRNQSNNDLICKGTTTQVFVSSSNMELSLVVPSIYSDWKIKNGL